MEKIGCIFAAYGGPMAKRTIMLLAIIAAGCSAIRLDSPSKVTTAFAVSYIALPGGKAGGVAMDYLAYDRVHHQVWVPAGNTGRVDVVHVPDERVASVEGFATAEIERRGTKRTVGPSSATVGDGIVYVGNRGDSSVCAVDAESLRVGSCITLDSSPDGLAYVRSTREVWATTARDHSIVVIDTAGGTLRRTATIALDGQPEGFAVDDTRGIFYTNLEDKDRTLAIDTHSRQVTSTWLPDCGEDGPKGLALDVRLDYLAVACIDHVLVLDAGHDGKLLSTLHVGEGVDNIDYVEQRHELYVAAARAATLTIARLDPQGGLTLRVTVATKPGARNAVATDEGTAYLTDSSDGKILVVAPVELR
jgi:DNA-binding beta-propeller fold protein YncE